MEIFLISKKLKKQTYREKLFFSAADTEPFIKLIAREGSGKFTLESVVKVLRIMRGSCSAIVGMPDRIIAIRDPSGNRPLYWGKKGKGYVVASETCALNAIGIKECNEVFPGTIISFSPEGIDIIEMPEKKLKQCSFELVYFAFPTSRVFGVKVSKFRTSLGQALAQECLVETDLIIGVPNSAIEAAKGFSLRKRGVPADNEVLYRRHDVRSFIEPTQKDILHVINLKFAFDDEAIAGKKVLLIDDSIVRGNTSRAIVKEFRERGAKEVHFASTLPPILHFCEYGIYMKNKGLIASDKNNNEIADFIGADSVTYLSMESFHNVFRQHSVNPNDFCFACMDGNFW